MTMEANQLILGDCLEVMRDIPDGSVDMILCDLPYGTTACKWDTVIPFEPLWEQYKRVIKKNGAVVLTASQPFTTALAASNLKWLRYELIWEKDLATGFLDARRRPLKAHENILVFAKGRTTYNPQMTTGKPYKAKMGRTGSSVTADTAIQQGGWVTENSGERFPRSIQKINTEKGLHPTQKPVALFEYLIRTYTNPGETVLDNCAGSGTTAIAALNTGRHFICIERDPEYYRIASERIASHQRPLPEVS